MKKKIADKIIKELIQNYENEKMIQNGGYIKKIKAKEIIGGLKNV